MPNAMIVHQLHRCWTGAAAKAHFTLKIIVEILHENEVGAVRRSALRVNTTALSPFSQARAIICSMRDESLAENAVSAIKAHILRNNHLISIAAILSERIAPTLLQHHLYYRDLNIRLDDRQQE